jgi:hypothetical protein
MTNAEDWRSQRVNRSGCRVFYCENWSAELQTSYSLFADLVKNVMHYIETCVSMFYLINELMKLIHFINPSKAKCAFKIKNKQFGVAKLGHELSFEGLISNTF